MSEENKNKPVNPASAVGVKNEESEQRTSQVCLSQFVRDPLTDRQPGRTGAEHRPDSSASTSQVPRISVLDQSAVGGMESVSDESKGARSKSWSPIKMIGNLISLKKNKEKGPTDTESLKIEEPQSKMEKSPQNKLRHRFASILSEFFSSIKSPERDIAEARFQDFNSYDGTPGRRTFRLTPASASWNSTHRFTEPYLEDPDENLFGSVSTTEYSLSDSDNAAQLELCPEHQPTPRSPESDGDAV